MVEELSAEGKRESEIEPPLSASHQEPASTISCLLSTYVVSFPTPLPLSLLQGSQDSTGGQEGLVAPPFAAFPPPPPPQNGLPGTEFGPGTMFGAGGQGTAEVGGGANGATTTTTTTASNNVSTVMSS